jgi:Cu(I)/Ag(I) efflux system membrane protein CusA/SilA
MTVAAAFTGLVPLLWASGTGADVMRRLAAPMLGGLFTSFAMELLIYPVIFYIAKTMTLPSGDESHTPPAPGFAVLSAAHAGVDNWRDAHDHA